MDNFFFFVGMLAVIAGQIWLVLIITRGSPLAGLLCLVIPFLYLFLSRNIGNTPSPLF